MELQISQQLQEAQEKEEDLRKKMKMREEELQHKILELQKN